VDDGPAGPRGSPGDALIAAWRRRRSQSSNKEQAQAGRGRPATVSASWDGGGGEATGRPQGQQRAPGHLVHLHALAGERCRSAKCLCGLVVRETTEASVAMEAEASKRRETSADEARGVAPRLSCIACSKAQAVTTAGRRRVGEEGEACLRRRGRRPPRRFGLDKQTSSGRQARPPRPAVQRRPLGPVTGLRGVLS
jgi:hypothetical protein